LSARDQQVGRFGVRVGVLAVAHAGSSYASLDL
jgi:hypothetical protein